jgi:tetratricopeptide (TPR) repeat protein
VPRSSPVRVRRWLATAILTLFFIAVAGAAAIGWWYARESPPHQGPIVVISVDGLAATTVEPAGTNEPAATPRPEPVNREHGAAIEGAAPALAAFARSAVAFDRAYTHSPQLLPAHASLLTGQLPFEHGVRDDGGYELAGSVRTLPELLRNRGFATGGAVSSFLLRPDTGIGQGFSFFDAGPDAAALTRPGRETLDAAERWARRQSDRRYFLLAQVDAADADMALARVTALLEDQGFYGTSTIVLVGDRGAVDGVDGLDERMLRVPLFIKQPGLEGAGRRIALPVQHIDLVPTILDLVRAPVPGGLRGRSLRAILADADERLSPQPIYSEWLAAFVRFGGPPMMALTMNESRYLRGADERIVAVPSLAAVEPDGPDRASRIAEEPPTVEESSPDAVPLRATLDRLLGPRAIAPAAAPRPAVRDRLALAGYLHGLPPAADAAAQTTARGAELSDLVAAHGEAARLAGERRLQAAIRALQGIARAHPGLAPVHYQIGVLWMEAGRPAAAVAAFRAAVDLRPDTPEVPRAMALALAQLGESDAAREQAALAVALARPAGARHLARAYEAAARVALRLGDNAVAIEAADAAQAADPSLPMHAYIEGRLLHEAGRHDDSVALLQEATLTLEQHGSALEGVYETLASALAALDRSVEAETAYRMEIRAFPGNVTAYTRLAALLREPDRLEDAGQVLAALLAAVPTPEAYAAAARTWSELGHRSRAEALRSEARARFRGDQALAIFARERAR